MTIWDFKPKGDLVTTVAVGVGVAAAPVVVPWAWSAVRPLLKAVLKGGFMLYEMGRGACVAAAEWTGPEKAKEGPTVKPKKAAQRARVMNRDERAVAQNLGIIEEQLTGKEAHAKPSKPKPKRPAKTAKRKTEEKK